MNKVMVDLSTLERVKDFVNVVSKFDGDFDLVSGRYVINAKSIMGVFSLDLSKPIELRYNDEEFNESVLEKFIVK